MGGLNIFRRKYTVRRFGPQEDVSGGYTTAPYEDVVTFLNVQPLSTKELLALPEGEYVSLLARIAVKASQTGREELIFSPKDREKVGAKVVAEANRLRSGAPAPEKADGTLKGALKEVGSAVAAAASQIKTGTAFTLASDTREMAGGVILRDGSIEINCAFETQLRLLRDSMAGEVAGILFS